MPTTHPTTAPTPADMQRSRALAARFFSSAAGLPISFVLDGQAISGIPADWQPVSSRRPIDANITETVFEGTDPATGLRVRVELTEYHDYPVVEWVAWLTNMGDKPTPMLRDIQAMDGAFAGAAPTLWHCNGDFVSQECYTPEETALHAGDTLHFAPDGGRPCDRAFPYFRLMFEDWGLSLAIGWPAQWAASFTAQADGVHVRAGQELTDLHLLPGESIRTPRMTVLSWAGDASRAVNLWRRWYLAHVLPRPDGRPRQPLLACCGTDDGIEWTAATEANQLRSIERFKDKDIAFDVWWIDAGWYPCFSGEGRRDWAFVGTWKADPERFPNGLRPVSDRLTQAGADLLLWFEPERVMPGTELADEHPEWLLWNPKQTDERPWKRASRLLNLGIPACRQWITERVCRLIQEYGVKIYRQDFNFPPLGCWRENEAPDRQGMYENLYVQGYLQFWDDLLARNPGLWLDSCASGGRRNDLESMRRSVPLHYSDNGYGIPPVKLAFHRTMYEWIPYFKDDTRSWDIGGPTRFDHRIDSYSYHCGMAAMLFATLDIRRDDYDYALAKQLIGVWRRAAGLLLCGDYYPHTPFHRSDKEWVAWQFDSPETGRGLVQGIRFPEAPAETLTIHPQGMRPDADYVFENPETGETRDVAGTDLIRDGFTFALPARSGAIWFYQTDMA